MKNFSCIVLFVAMSFFLMACDGKDGGNGPLGPSGIDGADGADGVTPDATYTVFITCPGDGVTPDTIMEFNWDKTSVGHVTMGCTNVPAPAGGQNE